jgi:Holliday junction DNA helicase RuvA
MYAYIHGILDEVENQRVVIDANGVGYLIFVPNSILHRLPPRGEKVKLFTFFYQREDSQELYGFLEKEEKQFFEKLITVSGVGPKAALNMLSAFTGRQLAVAIVTGDRRLLCTAPGIGKKTAERIILELKDKIDNEAITSQGETPVPITRWNNERMEALEALQALGYPAAEAERALAGLEEKDPSELVRLALKNIGNRAR